MAENMNIEPESDMVEQNSLVPIFEDNNVCPEDTQASPSLDTTMEKPAVVPQRSKKRSASAGGKSQKGRLPEPSQPQHRSRHLQKLEIVELDVDIPLQNLNACQINGRTLDPKKVQEYLEMLELTEPPNCVVIRDSDGIYHMASGHHRGAAALKGGRSTIKGDIYAGNRNDAIIVGGELNQGPVPMTLAAKKAHLDAILESGVTYSTSEMAAMTGLDRHTVAKRIDDRKTGDFIGSVGNIRREKNDQERVNDIVGNLLKQVKRYGLLS